jgi:hypothetical protein
MDFRKREQNTSSLPEEIRKELRGFFSKQIDEAINLVVNLAGKPISERRRIEVKREFELKEVPKFENAIAKAYQVGLEIQEAHQQGSFTSGSLRDRFYLLTDIMLKATPGFPRNVHAMDHLFQLSKELLKDSRLGWPYLKGTRYSEYLQELERLMDALKRGNRIDKTWGVLTEFRGSKDFFLLLQATLQRLIEYYHFLEEDLSPIEKKQVDRYMDIYAELAGHYEKFIALMATLIQLLETNANPKYAVSRSRRLSQNMRYVENSGWGVFLSGFNRNMRNAIAHKTFSVNVVNQTVEFIDRKKVSLLTYSEVQKETRELSALLLMLLHVFVSTFCLLLLSLKEVLDSLED